MPHSADGIGKDIPQTFGLPPYAPSTPELTPSTLLAQLNAVREKNPESPFIAVACSGRLPELIGWRALVGVSGGTKAIEPKSVLWQISSGHADQTSEVSDLTELNNDGFITLAEEPFAVAPSTMVVLMSPQGAAHVGESLKEILADRQVQNFTSPNGQTARGILVAAQDYPELAERLADPLLIQLEQIRTAHHLGVEVGVKTLQELGRIGSSLLMSLKNTQSERYQTFRIAEAAAVHLKPSPFAEIRDKNIAATLNIFWEEGLPMTLEEFGKAVQEWLTGVKNELK